MTISIIELYIWGFIISLNWMLAWQATTLKVKFLKIWLFLRRKKAEVYTPTDFDDYVGFNWGLIGELVSCSICFSHWVGALVTSILIYLNQSELYLIPLSFFTYPVLIHIILRKILN